MPNVNKPVQVGQGRLACLVRDVCTAANGSNAHSEACARPNNLLKTLILLLRMWRIYIQSPSELIQVKNQVNSKRLLTGIMHRLIANFTLPRRSCPSTAKQKIRGHAIIHPIDKASSSVLTPLKVRSEKGTLPSQPYQMSRQTSAVETEKVTKKLSFKSRP